MRLEDPIAQARLYTEFEDQMLNGAPLMQMRLTVCADAAKGRPRKACIEGIHGLEDKHVFHI